MRRLLVAIGVFIVLVAAALLWPKSQIHGMDRFFADDAYNFEAMRVLNDSASAGGDLGEALIAIDAVRQGNAQSWYQAWTLAGDRATTLAKFG